MTSIMKDQCDIMSDISIGNGQLELFGATAGILYFLNIFNPYSRALRVGCLTTRPARPVVVVTAAKLGILGAHDASGAAGRAAMSGRLKGGDEVVASLAGRKAGADGCAVVRALAAAVSSGRASSLAGLDAGDGGQSGEDVKELDHCGESSCGVCVNGLLGW